MRHTGFPHCIACKGVHHFSFVLSLQFQPSTPKSLEQTYGGFLRAMSDAGLKPTVVYHNLTPAELYEKVGCKLACNLYYLVPSLYRPFGKAVTDVCSQVFAAIRIYFQALQYEPGSHLVSSGALATLSGQKLTEETALNLS